MKKLLLLGFLLTGNLLNAQGKDEKAVRDLLSKQTKAWNEGKIEEFMKGYWESDSLMFVGKTGVTYGYAATLDKYKKGYPDKAAMGELTFTLVKIKKLSGEYQFVVGKWYLKRSIGDVSGYFNLLFQKIKGTWVIIVDHSS
jgi:hypothetical protein